MISETARAIFFHNTTFQLEFSKRKAFP
jgi:ActR/RegA family two-component response regulator